MTIPVKIGCFLLSIKGSMTGCLFLPHSLFPCWGKPFFCNTLFQHRRKHLNALRCKYYPHRWINLQAQNNTQTTKTAKNTWRKINK